MGVTYSELTLQEPSIIVQDIHVKAKEFCKNRFESWTVEDTKMVHEYISNKQGVEFNIKWNDFFDALENTEHKRKKLRLKKTRMEWHPTCLNYSMQVLEKEIPFIEMEENEETKKGEEKVEAQEIEYKSTDEELSHDEGSDIEREFFEGNMRKEEERKIKREKFLNVVDETIVVTPPLSPKLASAFQSPKSEEETNEIRIGDGEKKENKENLKEADIAKPDNLNIMPLIIKPLIAPNQAIPPLWNPELICPIFFGYALQTVDESEQIEFETNLKNLQENDEYNESRKKAEKVKLDELLQKVASRQKTRAKLGQARERKKDKDKKTRADELSAAKESLSSAEFKIYKSTWEKSEKEALEKELIEDNKQEEIERIAEATDATTIEEARVEFERIRKEDESMSYKPRGEVLQLRAEKAFKIKKAELIKLGIALKQAEIELLVVQENPGAVRGMVIMAEGNVKKCENELKALEKDTLAEENALRHAAALRAIEDPYMPLWKTLLLNKNSEIEEINFLELLIAIIIHSNSQIEKKIDFTFDIFDLDKSDSLTSDEMTILISFVINVLEKLGGVTRRVTIQEMESVVQQAIANAYSQGVGYITKSKFLKWCRKEIFESKQLANIFKTAWKYDIFSTFQTGGMSIVHRYHIGLISLLELQYFAAAQKVQIQPELIAERKNACHELALAFGQDDPTKADYSRFIPKRNIGERTHVIPLLHGAYKNLEHHISDTANIAATKLQSNFRGFLGRQSVLFEKERDAFYLKLKKEKENNREEVEREFEENELSGGVTKVKWNAKVRMRQVKLRAAGKQAERENTLEVMINEEVAQREIEIEAKFKRLAEEKGFYREHSVTAEEAFLQFKAKKIAAAELLKSKATPLHNPRINTNQNSEIMNLIKGINKKANYPSASASVSNVASEGNILIENKLELLDVKREITSEGGAFNIRIKRADLKHRMRLIKEKMLVPPNMYPVPMNEEEKELLFFQVANPNYTYNDLYTWILGLNKSVTPLKAHNLLLELPSKNLIINRVLSFRHHNDLHRHLMEHFKFSNNCAEELAKVFRGMVKLDYESGIVQCWVDDFLASYYKNVAVLIRSKVDTNLKAIDSIQERKKTSPNYTAESAAVEEDKNIIDEVASIELLKINVLKNEDKFNKSSEATNEFLNKINKMKLSKSHEIAFEEEKKPHENPPEINDGFDLFDPKEVDARRYETAAGTLRRILPKARSNWYLRFFDAINLPEETPEKFRFKYKQIASVHDQFLESASFYGATIIKERYLSVEDKTIKPISFKKTELGIIRYKYLVCNIRFKFATDDHGMFNCCDESAAKAAAGELRGQNSYLKFREGNLNIPPIAFIDFLGFRLVAVPNLPLTISKFNDNGMVISQGEVLLIGSSDRGDTIKGEDPVLLNRMNNVAKKFNTLEHGVLGLKDLTAKFIQTSADLKVFKGNDGKFHALNFWRVFPPESYKITSYLSESPRGMSIFWRFLRPEFVYKWSKPLCSDGHSLFISLVPGSKEINEEIDKASQFLVEELIPSLAANLSYWDYNKIESTDITTLLHSKGINIRHLGYLRHFFFHVLSGVGTFVPFKNYISCSKELYDALYLIHLNQGGKVSVANGDTFTLMKRSEVEEMLKNNTVRSNLDDGEIQDQDDEQFKKPRYCIYVKERVKASSGDENTKIYLGYVPNSNLKINTLIREKMLIELVSRAIKQLYRSYLRKILKSMKTANDELVEQLLLNILNLMSGASFQSEEWWNRDVVISILFRFGENSLSDEEKSNLFSIVVPLLAPLIKRFLFITGGEISSNCLKSLDEKALRYQFVLSDIFIACKPRVKMNYAVHHFAKGVEQLFEARQYKTLSYSACVLTDQPVGYWRMNDSIGSKICPNLGTEKEVLNAKISSEVVLEQPGFVVNEGIDESHYCMRFIPREEVSNPDRNCPRLDLKYHPSLAIENPDLPFSIEAFACLEGGFGKNKTICMTGRMALVAFKSDLWGFVLFLKEFSSEITIFGSKITLGTWTHLIGTYDGTIARFYCDGVLQKEVDVDKQAVDQERERREEKVRISKAMELKESKKILLEMENGRDTEENRINNTPEGQKDLQKEIFKVKAQNRKEYYEQQKVLKELRAVGKEEEGKKALIIIPWMYKVDLKNKAMHNLKEIKADEAKKMVQDIFNKKREEIREEELAYEERTRTRILDAPKIGAACAVAKTKNGRDFFAGKLQHVAIYNTCLPEGRVTMHYYVGMSNMKINSYRLFFQAALNFKAAYDYDTLVSKPLEYHSEAVCSYLELDDNKFNNVSEHIQNVRKNILFFADHLNSKAIICLLEGLPDGNSYTLLAIEALKIVKTSTPDFFENKIEVLCKLQDKFNIARINGEIDITVPESAFNYRFILKRKPYFFGKMNLQWLSDVEENDFVNFMVSRVRGGLDLSKIDFSETHATENDIRLLALNCGDLFTEANFSSNDFFNENSLSEEIVSKFNNLTILKIENNRTITDLPIVNVSKYCKMLQFLSLHGCTKLTNDSIKYIMMDLANSLKSLDLRKIGSLTDEILSVLAANKVCNLENLNVSYNQLLTDVGLLTLKQNSALHKTLTSLDISCCPKLTNLGLTYIGSIFFNLKSLFINFNEQLSDIGLKSITHSLINLEKIEMQEVSLMTDRIFEFDFDIGSVLMKEKMLLQISSLDVSGCINLTSNFVNIVRSRMAKLQSLNLSKCNKIDPHCIRLLTFNNESMTTKTPIPNTLKILNLSFCMLIDNSCLSIFASHYLNLEELYLDGCYLITDDFLINLLKANSIRMTKLSLSHCNLLTDVVIKEGIILLKHLEFLDISYLSKLTEEAIILMIENLKELSHLNLKFVARATDKIVDNVCKFIPTLKILDISCCAQISDDVISRLKFANCKMKVIKKPIPQYTAYDGQGSTQTINILDNLNNENDVHLSDLEDADEEDDDWT